MILTRNSAAMRRAQSALVTAAFAAMPALAQQQDYGALGEDVPLDEQIPDVVIPDVEIPDVQIPDVRIGANDAVVLEEEQPPPTAVFNEAPNAAEVDARARAEAARDEARDRAAAEPDDSGDGTQPAFAEGDDAALDNSVPLDNSATGDVRAIDLVDGTLEVETDTRGTLVLKAQQEQLRQLAPGQSISLTYVDRDDGRWLSELQVLLPPAPPAPAP